MPPSPPPDSPSSPATEGAPAVPRLPPPPPAALTRAATRAARSRMLHAHPNAPPRAAARVSPAPIPPTRSVPDRQRRPRSQPTGFSSLCVTDLPHQTLCQTTNNNNQDLHGQSKKSSARSSSTLNYDKNACAREPRSIDKHEERWAYGHADFAAAAYCLDPEFIDHSQESNEEVVAGFMNVAEKIGILREVRRQLRERDEYAKQFKKRAEAIGDDPTKLSTYDAYPTYPSTADEAVSSFCAKVNMQLALYRTKKGIFARQWVVDSATTQPAYMWWDANGASCVELQYMARLVLSQPASSSICERINGEFAFVKDLRRNRLEHSKAQKLVAIFHNLRLMFRMKQASYVEPAIGWNQEDNKTGVTKFGITNYDGCGAKKLRIAAPVRPVIPWEALFEDQSPPLL
ncbi:hypothetical protein AB1Y20_012207 [Prymnesium parvum]|uniref:HAT C-terminal dimerisation domain-containing protein n=1 Tax=Prymnesium parvum TaxID=97485 RepID=A0AB34IMV8_PRYPA